MTERLAPLRRSLPVIAPALVVATWSAARGHVIAPSILLAVALGVLLSSVVAPGLLDRLVEGVALVAVALGRAVSVAFAVLGLVTVVTPLWLFHRLGRRSALADGWEQPGTAWRTRSSDRDGHGRPAGAARLGTDEARPGPRRHRGRAPAGVAAVAVLVVCAVVIGPSVLGGDGTQYAHGDEPWYRDHLEDLSDLRFEWDPTLGTVSREHDGATINITDDRRATYQPPGAADLTIWYFGGSTMFGVGQRDLHTLPSVVAKAAEADGIKLDSQNFGIQSWANWQETLKFAMELQTEPPPDLVVFYDGVNELGLGFDRTRRGDTDPDRIGRVFTSPQERKLWTSSNPASPTDSIEVHTVLAATQYRRGVDLGRRLAESYGVEIVHMWQPDLVTKRYAPADEPAYELTGMLRRDPTKPSQAQDVLRRTGLAGIVDLTRALDEVTEPVYWDVGHTNELGARVIGEAMYEELEPVFRRLAEAD